jgi:hypothetical protein
LATKEALKKVPVGAAAASSGSVGRTMKMCSPHCSICQVPNAPLNWYMFCEHDPYITKTERPVREPVVEDDPDTPGQRIVTGEKTKLVYTETPNFTQVAVDVRMDAGNGYRIARECGFKEPQELGFSPFCQYRDCWKQDLPIKTTQYGSYCSEIHAKLIKARMLEILLDATSDKRREEQLSGISLP